MILTDPVWHDFIWNFYFIILGYGFLSINERLILHFNVGCYMQFILISKPQKKKSRIGLIRLYFEIQFWEIILFSCTGDWNSYNIFMISFIIVKSSSKIGFSIFLVSDWIYPTWLNKHSAGTKVAGIHKIDIAMLVKIEYNEWSFK